eukprot:984863-Lingulodinium_polyedra.AAC.1
MLLNTWPDREGKGPGCRNHSTSPSSIHPPPRASTASIRTTSAMCWMVAPHLSHDNAAVSPSSCWAPTT